MFNHNAVGVVLLALTGCLTVCGDYLDINECFAELPDLQLAVDSMAVEAVEFKDDCLRACLRSYLRGRPCASVEHRPKDNYKISDRISRHVYYRKEPVNDDRTASRKEAAILRMCARGRKFKDECLRLCLAALIRGTRCLSAMHIPGDDQCVISDQDQLTRPDLFVENDAHHTFTVNYFRNTCVDPPLGEGGRLEARLTGYRGGEGILELAQRKGQNPKLLAIMTGLEENKNFHLIYAPDVELASCHKAAVAREHDKKLITIDSDNRGMAIQPWTEINFHILDDSIIDKVVLVVEAGTTNVVDCGKLQIHGNASDWQRALSGGGSSTIEGNAVYLVVALIALLTVA